MRKVGLCSWEERRDEHAWILVCEEGPRRKGVVGSVCYRREVGIMGALGVGRVEGSQMGWRTEIRGYWGLRKSEFNMLPPEAQEKCT